MLKRLSIPALFVPSPALAHVSERALVLLLPTGVYTAAGIAAVAATVVLTAVVRPMTWLWLYPESAATEAGGNRLSRITSLAALALLLGLCLLGLFGPRDPLRNLLPLTLHTAWWIVFPCLVALFGDLWRWISPFAGLVETLGLRGRWRLPGGYWPALPGLLALAAFALTDIAPDDPARLAQVVLGYLGVTLVVCAAFGRDWLDRGEPITVTMGLYARLSPFRAGLRMPGADIVSIRAAPLSLGVFAIALLAVGSFDGLNETFWWMARLGINPLEFPGRSFVVWPNRAGLLGAVVVLALLFAACVWLGLALIGRRDAFASAMPRLALTLMPIALGYHFAHYLTSAMVNLQYWLAALNDPFATGSSLLGYDRFHVTTSFFNQHHTVRAIWITQAAAIVAAHMLAVVLSHVIALRMFDTHRAALVSQAPVAAFMVLYTFFGLWLLASPVAL